MAAELLPRVRAGVRGQEAYKLHSPMNGRGGEAVDLESLPQANTWLPKAQPVPAANLEQRAGGRWASVTLRGLSSFMARQAETKLGQGLDAQSGDQGVDRRVGNTEQEGWQMSPDHWHRVRASLASLAGKAGTFTRKLRSLVQTNCR